MTLWGEIQELVYINSSVKDRFTCLVNFFNWSNNFLTSSYQRLFITFAKQEVIAIIGVCMSVLFVNNLASVLHQRRQTVVQCLYKSGIETVKFSDWYLGERFKNRLFAFLQNNIVLLTFNL